MKPAELMEALALKVTERELKRSLKPGAMAWCKHCSRKHPRRQPCKLYRRTRVVDNSKRRGRRHNPTAAKKRVKRWAH